MDVDKNMDSDGSPVIEERIANISLAIDAVETKDEEEDESADREKFMALVKRSRQLAERGDIAKALQLNKEALAIHHSEKLEKRIKKMEAFLTQLDDSDDDENKEDMEDVGLGFKLHCSMAGKLYTHQKEGVLWLWSLFRKGKGGILADDMGLGKTIQVIAFLAGMFDMDKIKTVMIVVPLSVMPSWESEFSKWTPGINVTRFHGSSKKDREKALHRVRSRGGVMLTTYGLIVTQTDTLSTRFGREFVWDYIILDEGHKIKNKTKTSTGMNNIPAKNRIILTGTPVQNNLKELWALFDYVHQGSLLGTVRTFKMQFETPITRARERDASAVDKRLGQEMSDALKKIIQPYFLRRTKRDVAQQGEEAQDEKCAKMPELTRKNDIVLWVHLNEMQQKIYKDFLDLDEVKALLMTKKSPLVALTVLKKICDHPRLLSTRACMQLGLDGDDFNEDDLEKASISESAANKIDNIPDDVIVGEAGKMSILIELLDNFKMGGHKTLVFSQSRKLLDMIQRVITNRGHKVARLDGTVTTLEERKYIVDKFQKNPNYSVFLLTIQVGGVGLTITAADRVIIYDPSWNPAVDAQAVDRAYRIGQTQNVVVHRLISCATVEEKIYRRQVFKDSITRQTTGNSKNPYRYFTQMELRELFTLDDPRFSKTQQQLQEMHANQRATDESLDMHIAFLHSLDIFGISDHDLMFNDIHVRDDEEEDENMFIGQQEHGHNQDFIQMKIQKAQMLIAEESNNVLSYEQRTSGLMKFGDNSNRTTDPNMRLDTQPPSALFTQVMPPAPREEVIALSDAGNSAHEDSSDEVEELDQKPSMHLHHIQTIHIEDSDDEAVVKDSVNHEIDVKSNVKQEHHSTHNGFDLGISNGIKRESDMKPNVKQEHHDCSAHNGFSAGIKTESFVDDSDLTDMCDKYLEETNEKIVSGIISPSHQNDSTSKIGNNYIQIYDDDDDEESGACLNGSDVLFVNDDSDIEADNSDSGSEQKTKSKSRRPVSLLISHSEESKSVLHKRALQPLTQEDVDKRSPVVMRDGRQIVSEEIMISPDCSQPLIGLEASNKKKSIGKSFTTPRKFSSCRKLNLSATQNSPTSTNVNASSNSKASPAVLAVASPETDAMRQLLSVENSPNMSLNTSVARRSLSFGMESSPEITQTKGKPKKWVIDDSYCEDEENEQDENAIPVIETSDKEEDNYDDDNAEPQEADDVEVEEDEEMDDDNKRFQELIMIAKALYKKKDYQESLNYVEEALSIFQEPELEVMADKIRNKLEQAQEQT